MPEEKWCQLRILGKSWPYEVSTLGRVRSVVGCSSREVCVRRGKFVRLKDNLGEVHRFNVDFLVATCFLKNSHGLGVVHHIDGSSANSKVDNLQWGCDSFGRGKYGAEAIRMYAKARGFIAELKSVRKAAQEYGLSASGIEACCRRKTESFGGYRWRFAYDDEFTTTTKVAYTTPRPVRRYNNRGVAVAEYPSIEDAYKDTRLSLRSIKSSCTGHTTTRSGEAFRYVDDDEFASGLAVFPSIARLARPFSNIGSFRQYKLSGDFVQSFSRVSVASKVTGSSMDDILSCCHRELETVDGFIWRHKHDDEFFAQEVSANDG